MKYPTKKGILKRFGKFCLLSITGLLITISLILISCQPAIPKENVCQTDSDCLPAQCCHATDAINKANAPDCRNTICTLECALGSIDCGQGSIACIKGACQVILYDQ